MDHNELYVANKLLDMILKGAFHHPNLRAMYTHLTLTYAEEFEKRAMKKQWSIFC